MDEKKTLKIALVKQVVYQDLYVCPTEEKDPVKVLFSSMGRVGPMGLLADLNADFYIVNTTEAPETAIWKKVIPHLAKYLPMLKTETLDKIPGQEFKQPGSPYPNGQFSVDVDTVDWGQYDIVISINVSLPTAIVLNYPQTLFAYMIGEVNLATNRVYFDYDVALNQMARGIVAKTTGHVVDFPYTFVDANTLERILHQATGRPSKKEGIFMEINSTTERPVRHVPPHFQPLVDAGYRIILHKQKIEDNLLSIYDSKYFVKMGGRTIRGNSVAEAVSLGSLAIMDRSQVIHKELIIDECDVKTMDEMVALINRLEKDEALYQSLLDKERAALHRYFFETPLQSLKNCLEDKRLHHSGRRTYKWFEKLRDWLYLHLI